VPGSFEGYVRPPVRRACERPLQIVVEAAVDTCALMVAGLRLGLPAEEDDLFSKLADAGVSTADMAERLRKMKGLRNLLAHDYPRVDDRIVFETLRSGLGDLEAFMEQVARYPRERASG